MTFDAMRSHPEKYAPGAVVVGVPFETGIQYLQDLHKVKSWLLVKIESIYFHYASDLLIRTYYLQ